MTKDQTNWIFKINRIKKVFSPRNNEIIPPIVFRNINVRRGTMTIITGETGIGKTTLLNMLGLMDDIVFSAKDDILFMPETRRRPISYKRIFWEQPQWVEKIRFNYFGFMFQQDHLIDAMTGWENVILPYLLRYPEASIYEAIEKAEQIIVECRFHDMLNGLMERSPSTFSGGQRQRAALVRALIHDPMAIFADEPLASVDQLTAHQIVRTLAGQVQHGKTIIMVVHDTHEKMFEDLNVDIIQLSSRKKTGFTDQKHFYPENENMNQL